MHRFFILISIFSLMVLSCSESTPGTGKGKTSGEDAARKQQQSGEILRLKAFQVMDPNGFAQPVPVRTFLAPADWQLQGQVSWTFSQCTLDMYQEHAVVFQPDRQVALEIFPEYKWQWSNDQLMRQSISMSGCRVASPLNPRGVVEQYIIPAFRPGARVMQMNPSPEAAKYAYEKSMEYVGPMVQMGQVQLRADAGKALIEYQMNGGAYEEWITATVVTVTTQSWNSNAMMQGQMVPEPSHTFYATNMYGFRAPKGQLNKHEKLFATMMASMHINPAWENAVVQVMNNINRVAIQEAGKRAAIWRNAMNEVGQMQMQSWQQSQNTLDRISAAWSQTIRGVNAYVDPTTNQTVELTAGYENAWSNGAGEYILSTQPGFNPNSQLRTNSNWTQMKLEQ